MPRRGWPAPMPGPLHLATLCVLLSMLAAARELAGPFQEPAVTDPSLGPPLTEPVAAASTVPADMAPAADAAAAMTFATQQPAPLPDGIATAAAALNPVDPIPAPTEPLPGIQVASPPGVINLVSFAQPPSLPPGGSVVPPGQPLPPWTQPLPGPEEATGPTPTTIVAVDPNYKSSLDTHNTNRAKHQNTLPMGWDDVVAASAQARAALCRFEHEFNTGYGENLYASSVFTNSATQQQQGVQNWYNEISLYNYNNPVFSSDTGHFTQVVWKSSTGLGCGVANCPNGMVGWAAGRFLLVCRYKPQGNYVGQFADNVMPLIGSGGGSPPSPSPSPSPSPPTATATVIAAGQIIAQSSTNTATGPICRSSPNGIYSLCQRNNGRVELMKAGVTSYIWRGSPPTSWTTTTINNNRPFNLRVATSTGRLTVYNKDNTAGFWWLTTATGTSPFRIAIQNDGNVRILDSKNVVVWQTGTAGF